MNASPQNGPTRSASKRTRSSDSDGSEPTTLIVDPLDGNDSRHEPILPAFLRQSTADVQAKYQDLEWQQRSRILEAKTSKDPNSKWAQLTGREIKQRNRYGNISPWANCRVRLNVPEGTNDYINASPIVLRCSKSGKERKYIATQGPKEKGLDHFWHMIWQETDSVAVIVMLTQLADGDVEKCYQYYPEGPNSQFAVQMTNETGDQLEGKVKLVESTYEEASKTTVRKIEFSCAGKSKTVWHMLFLAWPDFGVPENEDRSALLELFKLSNDKNGPIAHPRIIHCSAGVGRSGTFIALEHLLAELAAGNLDSVTDQDDPVFDSVNRLREQRVMMVQRELQYIFLYDFLREEYRKRQNKPAPRTPVDPEGLAVEKIPVAGGEPSPKVMRLSKGIRRVFLRGKSRSRSRSSHASEKDGSSSEGKTPQTP